MNEITTVEELDALPVDDVLLRASGRYRYGMDGTFTDCWVRPVPPWITGTDTRAWEVLTHGGTMPLSVVLTEDIDLPATLLHPLPDTPAPSAEVGEASPIESQRTNSEDREALTQHLFETPIGYPLRPEQIDTLADAALAWLAARQPAQLSTPAQYAAALEDPALRRIAENARFGVGEVIDHVLRALGMEVRHDG